MIQFRFIFITIQLAISLIAENKFVQKSAINVVVFYHQLKEVTTLALVQYQFFKINYYLTFRNDVRRDKKVTTLLYLPRMYYFLSLPNIEYSNAMSQFLLLLKI